MIRSPPNKAAQRIGPAIIRDLFPPEKMRIPGGGDEASRVVWSPHLKSGVNPEKGWSPKQDQNPEYVC